MNGAQLAYHLRVNKYIDRQLFIECLACVDRIRPLGHYGYLTMGGAYLEDCRVIHNALGISRMLSFDADSNVILRQAINRPFGFVQCKQCDSRTVAEEFESFREAIGGPETNLITWLDYTMPKMRKEQLQDLAILVPELVEWDVVRVTMNAHRSTLGEHETYIRERDKLKKDEPLEESFPNSLAAWRHDRLRAQLGEDLPPDRDDADFLLTEAEFFRTILRTIKRTVVRALQGRPELVAIPLLSTGYADVQSMATATFVIVRRSNEADFIARSRFNEWQYKPGPEWDDFAEIKVPYLSLRERHIIHEAMIHSGTLGDFEPDFVSSEELKQYNSHYLRYPTFAPFEFT